MSLPELFTTGQHVQTPKPIGVRRAAVRMVAGGLLACVLAGVVIPVALAPNYPPALADVPLPTAAPSTTPRPDLAAAEVDIVRVTESTYASQPGDGSPIQYEAPRIMQAGEVLVQLTGVRIRGEEVTQGTQVVRFELIDALSGETLGAVDTSRVDGVDGEPAVLATLTEPKATYLRVASHVRGDGTCHGCQPGEYSYEHPIWHTWSALVQFDKAR
ncbi:hypothetical protein [Microbacterium aoyamense]|uniref:hypothetical protein n=1 Tax=Microbacterium aoyamense TaxID=344166 RepID=UPI0031CF0A91